MAKNLLKNIIKGNTALHFALHKLILKSIDSIQFQLERLVFIFSHKYTSSYWSQTLFLYPEDWFDFPERSDSRSLQLHLFGEKLK